MIGEATIGTGTSTGNTVEVKIVQEPTLLIQ